MIDSHRFNVVAADSYICDFPMVNDREDGNNGRFSLLFTATVADVVTFACRIRRALHRPHAKWYAADPMKVGCRESGTTYLKQ